MQYMGGKCRQSKAICEVIGRDCGTGFSYCEPFCGAMWSAVRVLHELHPTCALLADVNKPLMLLWKKCIKDGVDWLPTDGQQVEKEHALYSSNRDENDPLTAWYGFALSFGGKWFGGVVRHVRGVPEVNFNCQRESMRRKISVLREHNITLMCKDYKELFIPDGTVVYCDPPYEGRSKVHHFGTFDYAEFWQWVRNLSTRCKVYTSCFNCPSDFTAVHEWGDTVVRHYNSKGPDGTNEKLVVWKNAKR